MNKDLWTRKTFTATLSFFVGVLTSLIDISFLLGDNPVELLSLPFNVKAFKNKTTEKLVAKGSVVEVARQVQPGVVSIQALTQTNKAQGLSGQLSEVLGSGVILEKRLHFN